MMDDNTKIRVLMIYYEHWGKEEIRAQKALRGIEETMRMLDELDVEALLESFHHVCDPYDIHFLWTEFINVFLRDCGGCLDPIVGEDFFDPEELLFSRMVRLKHNLNRNHLLHNLSWMDDFEYHDALSVDAIVALV